MKWPWQEDDEAKKLTESTQRAIQGGWFAIHVPADGVAPEGYLYVAELFEWHGEKVPGYVRPAALERVTDQEGNITVDGISVDYLRPKEGITLSLQYVLVSRVSPIEPRTVLGLYSYIRPLVEGHKKSIPGYGARKETE